MGKVTFGALAALLVFAAAASPARAADAALTKAVSDCQTLKDPGKGAAACTIVIDQGLSNPKKEALIRYFRGGYYFDLDKNNEAIADLDKALSLYESAPDKASWDPDTVAVMGDAYSYRARAKAALKRCDEAKADFEKSAALATDVDERDKQRTYAKNACKG